MNCLNIDFRWAKPSWIGPKLKTDDGIETDYLGIPREGVCFGFAVRHPLANIETVTDVENYNWPLPEYWDYEVFVKEAKQFREEGFAVYGGQFSWPFTAACDLVGFEKFMILMIDKPEVANKVLEKLTEFFLGCSKIMFEKGKGLIDIFFNGDDYGHQQGPLISLDLWRKLIKPHIKRIFGLAKKYDLYILHHSCGSITSVLEDLIDLGLNAIEPVQVRAYDMDFMSLVNRFKGKVVLQGSIDTQKTLPFGTKKDVEKEVISRIELFKDRGGFVLAPSQHLLPEVPIDNIITMYKTAYEYGNLRNN
jgi:uroporphyrinogen decarboxylase